MLTAQSGIFALGTNSHSYLEFSLNAGIEPVHLAQAIAALPQPRMATGGLNLVVGFRPSLWSRVAPDSAPAGVADFDHALEGVDGYSMPATQHDLWVWVAGPRYDTVFDEARAAINALAPYATLADETSGWTYRENRDLTGFIDGTENPSLLDAPEVVIIPEGQPGAGSSIVLVQKWIHDVEQWEALPVAAQEMVIGRTKADSIELDDEVRGPRSHVARTVIVEQGEERHIFRRNTPFGTTASHGTLFIGFSAEQHRLDRMLKRMAGAEDGIRDALTLYTTALTGAYYVVPPVEALRAFAPAAD